MLPQHRELSKEGMNSMFWRRRLSILLPIIVLTFCPGASLTQAPGPQIPKTTRKSSAGSDFVISPNIETISQRTGLPLASGRIPRKMHVGLFSSTGCYSHDAMLKRIGDRIASHGHDITWAQTRVFEFNRTRPVFDPKWTTLIYEHNTREATEFVLHAQAQMWHPRNPFNFESRWWNVTSAKTTIELYGHHQAACKAAIKDPKWFGGLKARPHYDLIIVDYILQECLMAVAGELNFTSIIYASNYPVNNMYTSILGVPSNPALVPTFVSTFPKKMTFLNRVENVILHNLISLGRVLGSFATGMTFREANVPRTTEVFQTEEELSAFGTPFEYFLDLPRPQIHQLKYFGCSHCYRQTQPVDLEREMNITKKQDSGIVLISFGGTVSGREIPIAYLRSFLAAFAQFNETFIWQFGSGTEGLDLQVPPNVHLLSWVPIPRVMAHPDFKLLISHGGINTYFEAKFKVPVLLIPLHGDQRYTVSRILEKGVAESLDSVDITTESVVRKLNTLFDPENRKRYDAANRKLGQMIMDYKNLDWVTGMDGAEFWNTWLLRHGAYMKQTRHFYRFKPLGFFTHYSLDIISVALVVISLALWLSYPIFSAILRKLLELGGDATKFCPKDEPKLFVDEASITR